MPTFEALGILRALRRDLAGHALTGRQAKLYSQRIRREMGQPGLATFRETDVAGYLDEALWLIEGALLERSAERASQWRRGIKRGAEILEFLSQNDLRPAGAPLHLLSAAAYQVAGFPAMALAQLERMPQAEDFSAILREFLRANFPKALEACRQYWRRASDADALPLPALVVQHVVMCIGTVCTYFKTGDDQNVQRAIAKFGALGDSYLHSRDPYSYLLARLVAVTCEVFVESSVWNAVKPLSEAADGDTRAALQQFSRSAFANRRALVWPAQAAGIERLANPDSFVLCTPTGSGKTTVATLAIVQGLFTRGERPLGLENLKPDNLILYIVPSRALAAEVEKRLAEDLRGIAATPIVVTGLYGGVDWGPTDAWIQTEGPTIVICTFEKADALMRYLGVLFLHRVKLVVIDEAHMVDQRADRSDELRSGTSRELRLELLGTRLLEARELYAFRMIALSAVAASAAPALARWVNGSPDATPTVSSHRSTRQMLGCIEVGTRGQFNIRYDLMDGRSLRFDDERRNDTPFVLTPFPPVPDRINFAEPDRSMRAPTLWAALHLAAERPDGGRPSVLISLTQNVGPFASDCADSLDRWLDAAVALPNYREAPAQGDLAWQRCLASAEDYFGRDSVEYRLLQHGVAVHHGKMPSLLARRLKTLIDRGTVRVIIATSTLSEGVNLPVSYLLIPSVYRNKALFALQEFTNLIGRAGRPGVSTEGHALVVLPDAAAVPVQKGRQFNRQRAGYADLVRQLEAAVSQGIAGQLRDEASSPLRQLLQALEESWQELQPNGTPVDFVEWLQETAVTDEDDAPSSRAIEYLDSLDAFLIAAIQEIEDLQQAELAAAELEGRLIRLWQRSYAFASVQEEERLRGMWLTRGAVIKQRYPDPSTRRQIYKSSLGPRSATSLLERVDEIRAALVAGSDYAVWSVDEKLKFIGDVLGLLSTIPSFQLSNRLGRRRAFDWRDVLRWWLAKNTLDEQPDPARVTEWYDYVAQNFIYRGAWGLGSVIGLLLDTDDNGLPIAALDIDQWPRSGLPWIAFWLKELVTWGTSDPVAAFLLARGDAMDRSRAEADAAAYYEQLPDDIDPNQRLDPNRIRDWLNARQGVAQRPREAAAVDIDVTLARPADAFLDRRLPVMHFTSGSGLTWIDPAGYVVARSQRPADWPELNDRHSFVLNVDSSRVEGEVYLPHLR